MVPASAMSWGCEGGPVTRATTDSLHGSDHGGVRCDVVGRNTGNVGVVEPVSH